jgi:predicted Abi (CAAX) family protease
VSTTASNYDVFLQADFNRPDAYPLDQTVDPALYRPLANWMGRLILPTLEQRDAVQGVLLELHHAPEDYRSLVGQVVYLRWETSREVQSRIWPAARDVYFTPTVEKSMAAGLVHPARLRRAPAR